MAFVSNVEKMCNECGATGVEIHDSICLRCFHKQKGGEQNMGKLGDFAKRNSQYISLDDGESVEAMFKSAIVTPNPYDAEKEVVNYKFDTEWGVKTLRSGACGLARIFDNIQPNTKIKLTRAGLGNKTSYKVEKEVDGKWVAVGKEAVEEED